MKLLSLCINFEFLTTSHDLKQMVYLGKGHAAIMDTTEGSMKCIPLENKVTMEIGHCDTTLGYQRDHLFFILVTIGPVKMSIMWNGMQSDVGRLYNYERMRIRNGLSPHPKYRVSSNPRMPVFHTDEEDHLFFVEDNVFHSVKTNKAFPEITVCKCEVEGCTHAVQFGMCGTNSLHQWCTKCTEAKIYALFLFDSGNANLLHALREKLHELK